MQLSLNNKKFSSAIKQKRIIELEIDLRKLSNVVKISSATISRCENGKMPDLITYAAICKWLDVPMEKFIVKSKLIKQ